MRFLSWVTSVCPLSLEVWWLICAPSVPCSSLLHRCYEKNKYGSHWVGEILESRPLCCGALDRLTDTQIDMNDIYIGVMPVCFDNRYCSSSMLYYPQVCLCTAVREVYVCYSQFIFLYWRWRSKPRVKIKIKIKKNSREKSNIWEGSWSNFTKYSLFQRHLQVVCRGKLGSGWEWINHIGKLSPLVYFQSLVKMSFERYLKSNKTRTANLA